MSTDQVIKQSQQNWADRKQQVINDLEIVCKALEEDPGSQVLTELKKDLEYQRAILCIYD